MTYIATQGTIIWRSLIETPIIVTRQHESLSNCCSEICCNIELENYITSRIIITVGFIWVSFSIFNRVPSAHGTPLELTKASLSKSSFD